MKDDSAEWMAKFKASGQLRPANKGERGDGDEARMGVVTNTNDEGRQVLGTCSPGRWLVFKASIREFLNLPMREATEEEQQSADEQTRVRSEWIRNHSRWEQQ